MAGTVIYELARDGPRLSATFVPHADTHGSSFTSLLKEAPTEFVTFIRKVIDVIEVELECSNYHLRVLPSVSPPPSKRGQLASPITEELQLHMNAAGFYVSVFGDNSREGEPANAEGLLDLDAPINYTDKSGKEVVLPVTSRDITVLEGASTRCALDAQGRPVYVVVFNRFVRYQSDCTDAEVTSG